MAAAACTVAAATGRRTEGESWCVVGARVCSVNVRPTPETTAKKTHPPLLPLPSYNSYGSSMYGGAGGMYGGSMYGGGGGLYGGGGFGAPYGATGALAPPGAVPLNPDGTPARPPGMVDGVLHSVGGAVNFFGRLSWLIGENAHAVHFLVGALLGLMDRAGALYGELARFLLRLIGVRRAKKALTPGGGSSGAVGAAGAPPARALVPRPSAGTPDWNGVWGGR